MNDITRLPKWAQYRIAIAEMRVRESEERVASLFGQTETNTLWSDMTHDAYRPLPDHSTVKFMLGRSYIEAHIDHLNNELHIYGSGTEMQVLPRAANSIYITFAEPPK